VSPSRKRAAVVPLEESFEVSERRACEVADQPRSTQRYEPRPASDEAAVVTRMHELVRGQPRFGYRQKPRKKRRLGTIANSCVRRRAEHRNHVWCWDFMFERTTQGSSLKWLSVVDEYTRECLVLKVSRSITSADVIDFFQGLFVAHGVPVHIRSDHGREFLAAGLRDWLAASTVGPLYVAPASPWENGYAESFHSEVRDEFLACEVFETVKDAQALGTAWRRSDNEVRPPLSLGSRTPAEFALACAASVRPTASLQQHTLNTPALS